MNLFLITRLLLRGKKKKRSNFQLWAVAFDTRRWLLMLSPAGTVGSIWKASGSLFQPAVNISLQESTTYTFALPAHPLCSQNKFVSRGEKLRGNGGKPEPESEGVEGDRKTLRSSCWKCRSQNGETKEGGWWMEMERERNNRGNKGKWIGGLKHAGFI